jgi:hypothetical protein
MGEHLLQQTLPPAMAAMAEYYEQGAPPPSAAEAAAGRYGHRAGKGPLTDAALDDVLGEEIERVSNSAVSSADTDESEIAVRAMASVLAAGLTTRSEALTGLARKGYVIKVSRLDAAVAHATKNPDYTSALATPRRDMDPALAAALAIDPARTLSPDQIAYLLNGQRADGQEIEGKKKQAATDALRTVFGLPRDRLPARVEIEHVLGGRKANGEDLPPQQVVRAVGRFQAALGAEREILTPEERENLLSGRSADGRVLTVRQYQNRLSASKSRIGYVDLTFSAPKSVSIAWAFAPTEAERAIIRQAHSDAIDSTMAEVERFIGRARKGAGGKDGWDAGTIAWVSFDHYAARPTVEVIRTTEDGEAYTELYTLKAGGARVAGDMQLHTHNAVFNVVRTSEGRIGGLDLAQLEGRVKEWGAVYQAFLASNLRRHGVEVGLDPRTEMARLMDVPERAVQQFSKRTLGGTAAARAYAASQGLDWDALTPERKIGLLKAGVQDPRGAKGDDVSDMEAWTRTARQIGYTHRSVLRPEAVKSIRIAQVRQDTAYHAAMPLLTKQFERRSVIDGSDVRTSAAKGFIAAGISTASEVSRLTQIFRQRGILQNGEHTGLIWGDVRDTQGRDKIAVTTALHEREEALLLERARQAASDKGAALTADKIDTAIKALPELDFTTKQGRAQRRIIDHLGTSGRLAVAIGVAGSGKSTLLKPLVRAWQTDGRIVHGIALSWRQTDDLKDTGIPKENRRAVEPFVRALASGRLKLAPSEVVVVDEIGLLGTRQLNEILKAREGQGFTLVAIGDPKQMQAVEAGPVIALLERALGPENIPTLGLAVRQRDAEERETVLMFRNNQTEEAVTRKAANGTLRIVPGGYEEAVSAIVTLWESRRTENRERSDFSITLSAPTNFDAHAISLAIRSRRRQLGDIREDAMILQASDAGWPEPRFYDLSVAVGDRVRLFRQTMSISPQSGQRVGIGRNGSVLEIRDLREEGVLLCAASGREGFVPWDYLRDPSTSRILLDYGEVLTTNTAQGSTVSEHIHAMPGGTKLVSAFGAYTAGSRHREQSFIVVSDGAERAEVSGRRPLGDRREIVVEDVIANIVRNFSRQPAKESSLALIERANRLRRGSIRALQTGAETVQRGTASAESSVFARRLDEGWLRQSLEAQSRDWKDRLKAHARTIAAAARGAAELAGMVAAGLASKTRQNSRYWQSVSNNPDTKPDTRQRNEQAQQPRQKL